MNALSIRQKPKKHITHKSRVRMMLNGNTGELLLFFKKHFLQNIKKITEKYLRCLVKNMN